MSSPENKSASVGAEVPEGTCIPALEEIDASCRTPVWVMLGSAAKWLVFALVLSLLASVNLHAEGGFMSHCPIFTYGRLYPAFMSAFIYGFGIQAAVGAALWLLARTGQTTLVGAGVATVGSLFWNLGVTFGVIAILAGWSTGFELLEMPFMVSLGLLAAYIAMAIPALFTLKNRANAEMYPTQYFVMAALFWFPWIYTAAVSLLNCAPVHGVMQAVIAWWYGANLFLVFFGMIGLGAIFYLIPLRVGKPLYSGNYAKTAFWLLLIVAPLTGIPAGAPVPAWLPAMSSAASLVLIAPLVLIVMNLHQTCEGALGRLKGDTILTGSYVGAHLFVLSVACIVIGPLLETFNNVFSFMRIFIPGDLTSSSAFMEVADTTRLSLFHPGADMLLFFGFFALTIMSVIHYAFPKVFGKDWPMVGVAKLTLMLGLAGVAIFCVPMIFGGFVQGFKLHDADVSFMEITSFATNIARARALGELALLGSASLLFLNIVSMLWKTCGSCCVPGMKDLLKQPQAEEAK